MASREQLIEVFEDTRRMYETEKELVEAVKASISGTKLYAPDEYPEITDRGAQGETVITVSGDRSLAAAQRLMRQYPGKKTAVHNFASATNPGGGVERGSRAQEECLCRCTTLFPVLSDGRLKRDFYLFHKQRHDLRYTDSCIYSPDIVILKTDTDIPRRLEKADRATVDIITCAAPNLRSKPYNRMNPGQSQRPVRLSSTELLKIHKKRALHMFAAAAANGAEILVLGAFGCGAFQNDPETVAKAYKQALREFDGYRFAHVEFAVYCPPDNCSNFDAFNEVFG